MSDKRTHTPFTDLAEGGRSGRRRRPRGRGGRRGHAGLGTSESGGSPTHCGGRTLSPGERKTNNRASFSR